MPGYSELIKNFEKIRDFTRDFFIYGFKGRGDYKDISTRSYDNERRRIESYLSEQIIKRRDNNGKKISISSNTTAKTLNPLFKIWQTKSFTKTDCFLHFVIIDILSEKSSLSVIEIAEVITKGYTGEFSDFEAVDTMTIRNKLNEYTKLGILAAEKRGKTLYYSMKQNPLADLKSDTRKSLDTALDYYKNILPGGFIGHSINRTSDSPFIYRQIFFSQTLDDEVLLQICSAIRDKKSVVVNMINTKSKGSSKVFIIPLEVLCNTRTGRRYVGIYSLKNKKYSTIRLDYIKDVIFCEVHPEYDEVKNEYEALMEKSFSIMNKVTENPHRLSMVLRIDEANEQYVISRIKREGKHGILTKVSDNVFEYTIDVADTLEMVPWLRTFTGRIIKIQGTERFVISQFKNDIETMMSLYND